MNRSAQIALGGVVLLAGIAAVVWKGMADDGRGQRETVAAHPESTASRPGDRERGVRSDLSAPTVTRDAGAQDAPALEDAPAAGRAAVDSAAILEEGESFELLVKHSETEEVLAGALVWALAVPKGDDDSREFWNLEKVDDFMQEHGLRLETDAQGRVRVPTLADGQTLVVASLGDLWGKDSYYEPEQEDAVLELGPDATISARVVTTAGAPVSGAPVALRYRRYNWHHDTNDRNTDAQGMATFRHVLPAIRQQNEDAQWFVALDVLLSENQEVPFERDAIPTEPVTLVLPDTGSVQLSVLGVEGEPYMGEARASLGIVLEDQERIISPFSNHSRLRVETDLIEGKATFPHVDLGQELEVLVTRKGARVPTRMFDFGPQSAGEVTAITVPLGLDHPMLRMRVVDASNVPIRNTELKATVDLTASFMSGNEVSDVSTDNEGRLLLDLGRDHDPDAARVLTLRRSDETAASVSASVDLNEQYPPGLTDLGDVLLDVAPLFVKGRVVDELGAGIAGAKLHLSRHNSEEESWWNDVWEFDHVADDQGDFEVYGTFTGVRFRLGAQADGVAGTQVVFEPGDAAMTLVLGTAGTLVGNILLDESIPENDVRIQIAPGGQVRGANTLRWSDQNKRLNEDGTFQFPRLIPGEYRVEIRLEAHHRPYLSFDDVQVVAGGESQDPRLVDIDLRGKLHAYHFTLTDPKGTTQIRGSVDFKAAASLGLEEGPDTEEYQMWFQNPEFTLLSAHGALDVNVSPQGFRNIPMEDVRGDQDLTLSAGLPVRLVLTGDGEVPEPPVFVKAFLVPVDSPDDIDWSAPAFDERRETVIMARAAGRMKVMWLVEMRSGNSAMATSLDLGEQFVEILDIPSEQLVQVELSAEGAEKLKSAL